MYKFKVILHTCRPTYNLPTQDTEIAHRQLQAKLCMSPVSYECITHTRNSY